MEVVEFEPERAFATIIREGPVEVHGRTTFEALPGERTRMTVTTEMPVDPRWDPTLITARLEQSVENIKRLIEADT